MEDKKTVVRSRPLSPEEGTLLKKFDEERLSQGQRLDELAKLLITVELAVPGIYAVALKLLSGQGGVVEHTFSLYITFVFWAAALACTMWAILPRRYHVDRGTLFQNRGDRTPTRDDALSVNDFFQRSARDKYYLIVTACGCLFAGICIAVFSIG